jgi:pyruvate dehydrogenase E2 component (dihydrolipoamide acetyltransferase)
MATEFRLPELGENIESGDVLKILVSVGDSLTKDQPVLELETDKATIEVPSPFAGTVKALHVKDGEKLKVGGLILTLEEGAAGKAELKEAQPEVQEKVPEAPKPAARVAEQPAVQPEPPRPAPRVLAVEVTRTPRPVTEAEIPREVAPAAPSIRRMARELGVDINQVQGSGAGGRITEEDVKRHVRVAMSHPAEAPPGVPPSARPLPDFSKWGEIERQPMRSVRRKTAQHLAYAWATIPHVTQYDKADITELEQLRKQQEAAGVKLAVTAVTLKVIASALQVFPQFAASIDLVREELIYKKYAHIGVAVDTDRGLLVPVIRDVDKKNILELSAELARAAERARNRKTTLEEMEGGVFTISNLGGIGGTNFSPIVNSPEVAILGVARASLEPRFIDGLFQPRLMLPLSLSYDHRVIDGADAARFLRWVAEALEKPLLLPLQG